MKLVHWPRRPSVGACMVAGLIALLVGWVPGTTAQRLEGPALFQSTASELVVVPVIVTDRNGQDAADLDRQRFQVQDNGRVQNIELFGKQDTPVSISLVIDSSGSMRTKIGEVAAGALALLQRSNSEDEIFVTEFNDAVRDITRGGSISGGDISQLERRLRSLVPQGRTALYDGIVRGLAHLDHARHARSVLLLISDGGDNASRATFDEVLDRAKRSNVTIYTLGLFDANDRDRNPGVLKELAEATGGRRFLPESPALLLQACEDVASEIRSGYLLAFVPPDRDGRYHRLRVRITGPESRQFRVRTRPGYLAATKP